MPGAIPNHWGCCDDGPPNEGSKLCFMLLFSFNLMLKIFKAIDFIYLINKLKKIKIFT